MKYVVREVQELPPLISVDAAAGIIGCSTRAVRAMCANGQLIAAKVGDERWRISSRELLKKYGLLCEQ